MGQGGPPGRDSFSPVSVNRASSVQLSQHDAMMQQQMFQQQQMQQMQRAAMEQQMLHEQQMIQEQQMLQQQHMMQQQMQQQQQEPTYDVPRNAMGMNPHAAAQQQMQHQMMGSQ